MSDRPRSYEDAKWDIEVGKLEVLESIAKSLSEINERAIKAEQWKPNLIITEPIETTETHKERRWFRRKKKERETFYIDAHDAWPTNGKVVYKSGVEVQRPPKGTWVPVEHPPTELRPRR